MSTRPKTGPKLKMNMKKFSSPWKKKYVKNSEKKYSQRSWLLHSYWENFKDGKVFSAKNQSRKNFKMKEIASLSNSVVTLEKPKKNLKQEQAKVLNKFQVWRNLLRLTMSRMWFQLLSGRDNSPPKYNQTKKWHKVYLETFHLCNSLIQIAKTSVKRLKITKMTSFQNGTTVFWKLWTIQIKKINIRWVANSWSSIMKQVVFWK